MSLKDIKSPKVRDILENSFTPATELHNLWDTLTPEEKGEVANFYAHSGGFISRVHREAAEALTKPAS